MATHAYSINLQRGRNTAAAATRAAASVYRTICEDVFLMIEYKVELLVNARTLVFK